MVPFALASVLGVPSTGAATAVGDAGCSVLASLIENIRFTRDVMIRERMRAGIENTRHRDHDEYITPAGDSETTRALSLVSGTVGYDWLVADNSRWSPPLGTVQMAPIVTSRPVRSWKFELDARTEAPIDQQTRQIVEIRT